MFNIFICSIIKNDGNLHKEITKKYGNKVVLIRLEKELTLEEHKGFIINLSIVPKDSFSFFIDADNL